MNKYDYKPLIWIAKTLLILSFLFPLNAVSAESIGHVIQSVGTLTATSNGKMRILKRGSRIEQGDVLKSGGASISQLRMNDGALIALSNNTEFRFDEYKYTKDEQSDSSIFSLLKGGFRTISGLIGKRNKQNYRVKTPVATIGIRGTHYGLTLCSQGDCESPDGNIEDGLYGSVIDGEIITENKAGIFSFSNDEYFHLTSETSIPRHLIKPPGVIFGQHKLGKRPKKMQADKQRLATLLHNRDQQQTPMLHAIIDQKKELLQNRIDQPFHEGTSTDDPNSLINSVPSFNNNVLSYSFFGLPGGPSPIVNQAMISDGTIANQFTLNAVAAGYGEFRLLKAVDTFGISVPKTRILEKGQAPVVDIGSAIMPDGTQLGWGRWVKGTYINEVDGTNVQPISDLHYVVASALTTPAQIGTLTGTLNYTTVAGTRATDLNGNMAANVATVKMDVTFNLTTTPDSIDYMLINTFVAGKNYAVETAGPISFDDTALHNVALTQTAGTCANCTGVATVGFVGKQAEGAFTTYNIVNTNTADRVNGSAILKQSGVVPF